MLTHFSIIVLALFLGVINEENDRCYRYDFTYILCFEGHPTVAFSGELKKERDVKKEAIPDEYQTLYGDKKEEPEHYFFPVVRAHGSGIDMLSACVKKEWFYCPQIAG